MRAVLLQPLIMTSLRFWNTQIVTNFSDQLFLDFSMTRDCRQITVSGIAINRMLAAFTDEETSVRFEVPDEVGSFRKI